MRDVSTMVGPMRSQLLISVRSVEEAEFALCGGADLIDIKEPRRGSLGKADDDVIAGIIERLAGQRPLSAAMGELIDGALPEKYFSGLQYVKWGLAGCSPHADWRKEWQRRKEETERQFPETRIVIAGYADWQQAQAPPVWEVVDFTCESAGNVLLLDTFGKSPGLNLLHWLSKDELTQICKQCRAAGVRIALAGSLGKREIGELLDLRPDWFAVRGAVCAEGRDSTVSLEKVQAICRLLSPAAK